jgi:hypothetical protein
VVHSYEFDYILICKTIPKHINNFYGIGGVIVGVLASHAVDCAFDARSGQTKGYEIGISCFSAKNGASRSKNKDWLSQQIRYCPVVHSYEFDYISICKTIPKHINNFLTYVNTNGNTMKCTCPIVAFYMSTK